MWGAVSHSYSVRMWLCGIPAISVATTWYNIYCTYIDPVTCLTEGIREPQKDGLLKTTIVPGRLNMNEDISCKAY